MFVVVFNGRPYDDTDDNIDDTDGWFLFRIYG